MSLKIRNEGRDSIYPNELKGWFFPNWFNKEHFEMFLCTTLSDKEFELWKKFLMEETNIYDCISNEVRGFLFEFLKEFGKYKLKEEVINGK